MRSSIRAAFAAALLLPLAACGDDDGAGADAQTADAATADASETPDAPPAADAAPDARPDAAPPGQVTLTILDPQDQGVEGLDVVWSNADGSLVSHMTTDASGQSTETVPGDAMVSLAVENNGNYVLYTIGNVQPGDAIVVNDFGAQAPPPGVHGTVNLSFPGAFAGAQDYDVSEGCNTVDGFDPAGGNVALEVSNACVNNSDQFSVVAQAIVSGQGSTTATAHSYLLDQTLPNGGQPLTMPAWSDQFSEVTVSTSNVPAGALGVFGDTTFRLGPGVFDMADDSIVVGGGSFTGLVPMGITPTAVIPAGIAAFGSPQNLTGFSLVQKSIDGLPSNADLDFAEAPRSATSGNLDVTTPARPIVNWTVTGTDSVTDFTQVQLSWSEGQNSYLWSLITRPNENGPVQLPELPAALSAFAPTGATSYDGIEQLYVAASWIPDDWPALRQAAGITPPQPATGWTIAASAPAFPEAAPALVRPSIRVTFDPVLRR